MKIINKMNALGFQQTESYSTPNGEVKELTHGKTRSFVIYVDNNGNIYANAIIYNNHCVLIGKLEILDIQDILQELGF